MEISVPDLVRLLSSKGYKVFGYEGKPYNLNIVGVRNIFGRPNYFDDVICVFWETIKGWTIRYYPATTLPGTPYMLKPVSENGAALLVPGQYLSSHKIGLHRQKYEALVQRAPVKVYRDNTKDQLYDRLPGSTEVGMFGINIHKAGLTARLVGVNSAGCQVIQRSEDYDNFMILCKDARSYWGNSFSYTLVEL